MLNRQLEVQCSPKRRFCRQDLLNAIGCHFLLACLPEHSAFGQPNPTPRTDARLLEQLSEQHCCFREPDRQDLEVWYDTQTWILLGIPLNDAIKVRPIL